MPQSLVNTLEKMLDYCAEKQKVISKNITNVGTNNYKREDIKFKDILAGSILPELKSSDPKHISNFQYPDSNEFEIIKDESANLVSGVNNVDIDTEMAEMAENTLKFKFAARKMSDYYKGLQKVIKGGGGV